MMPIQNTKGCQIYGALHLMNSQISTGNDDQVSFLVRS